MDEISVTAIGIDAVTVPVVAHGRRRANHGFRVQGAISLEVHRIVLSERGITLLEALLAIPGVTAIEVTPGRLTGDGLQVHRFTLELTDRPAPPPGVIDQIIQMILAA